MCCVRHFILYKYEFRRAVRHVAAIFVAGLLQEWRLKTDCQYQTKLSIDGDPRALIRDIVFSLKQCKHHITPHSCDARLFYKSLQFPFSAGGGVLCGTLNNFDTESGTAVLQAGMDWAISGQRDTFPVKNLLLLAVTIQKFKSVSSCGMPRSEIRPYTWNSPSTYKPKGSASLN